MKGIQSSHLAIAALTGILSFGLTRPQGRDHAVRVLTSAGKPYPGVIVYQGDYDPNGLGYYTGASKSDGRGVAMVEQPMLNSGFGRSAPGFCFVAIGKDWAIAVSHNPREIRFGPTGAVKLQLTDPSGRPLTSRFVELVPADKAEPLESTGSLTLSDLYPVPPGAIAARLSRNTDAHGRVSFAGLPVGVPFWVSTPISSANVMIWDGTVKPGESHTLVYTHDCTITGPVRDAKGRPVKGAEIEVGYTSYIIGSLDNAMDVVGSTRTRADGSYRLSHLPNCTFQVQAGSGSELIRAINGRKTKDPVWTFITAKIGRSRYDLTVGPGS